MPSKPASSKPASSKAASSKPASNKAAPSEPAPATRAKRASSAGEEVATGPEVAQPAKIPAETAASPAVEAAAEATSETPDEELRRKFREAMAAKHGTHGAEKSEHEDLAQSGHGVNTGPPHKMFRRKAGN